MTTYNCIRCGYQWNPKRLKGDALPVRCARCTTPYWNKPYVERVSKWSKTQ